MDARHQVPICSGFNFDERLLGSAVLKFGIVPVYKTPSNIYPKPQHVLNGAGKIPFGEKNGHKK